LEATNLKYFKLPTFLASQSLGRIARAIETEENILAGKCIITLLPAAHIKLGAAVHAKSHRFSLLPSKRSAHIHRTLHLSTFHPTVSGEAN
jgi:hypothetical protein